MNPEAQQLHNLIKYYQLDRRHPDRLRRVIRKIERSRMGPKEAKRWLRRIIPWVEEQEIRGNFLPKAPTFEELGLDKEPYDIELGHLVEKPLVPCGIRLSLPHALLCGKTKSGKTVTLRVFIKSIGEFNKRNPDNKIVLIIFDSKQDFKDAEQLLGEDCYYFSVHDKNFKIGLNGPADVPSSIWSNTISFSTAGRLGLVVARTVLDDIIKFFLPILNPNPQPGKPLNYPSPSQILYILENSPFSWWGAKTDYAKSLTQSVRGWIADSAGLSDTECGIDFNKDVIAKKKHCVIDISNTNPPYHRHLILDTAINQILISDIYNKRKTKKVKIIFIFDESDLFASPEAQKVFPDGLSPLCLLARLGYEFGLHTVVSVSDLRNVAPYIRNSASYIMTFNNADSGPIQEIMNTLLIDPRCGQMLPALKPGQCFFREAQGPYPYPYIAQINYIAPDHSREFDKYDTLPFTPARDINDPSFKEKIDRLIREHKATIIRQHKAKKSSPNMTKNERNFLTYMSLHEFEPINRLFARMNNPSPATQQKIIKKLSKLKLIETAQIRTSKSPLRLGLITEVGWDFLNDKSKFKSLRGDIVHTHVCRWKQALDIKQGCEESICEFQYPNSTGFGDVGSRFNGRWHCTEVINNCNSNICHHLKSCFIDSNEVETLTIVTLLKSEHKKLLEKIMSDPELVFVVNRIKWTTVDDILRELY